ncbi:MAG TPA: hypothetical protein PKZ49_06530 [Nitrosomonas sp.]|nr:hypothetical protein [Nitrosomonas sp.]HNE57990.1 hypothetical protein [Nitrosomonas sp.]
MQTKMGTAKKSKSMYDVQTYSNSSLVKKLYFNQLAVPEKTSKATHIPSEQRTSKLESDSDNCLLRRNGYFIREISSLKQRLKVNSLIKRRYASRGYNTDQTTVFSADKDQITFEACNESGQLGTLTLIIDLGKGLLADQHYQEEIDAFRGQAKKVCEVSKLAFNPSSSSKEIFASLFHIAYLYAYCIYGVKNAFIEINPRHAAFYKRMLGFEQIGEERVCKRVDAPAVLLRLDLEYMREKIIRNQATSGSNNKSIYGYFLNQNEEHAILSIIQNLPAQQKKSGQEKLSAAIPLAALNTGNTSTLLYNLFTEAIKENRAIGLEKLVYC